MRLALAGSSVVPVRGMPFPWRENMENLAIAPEPTEATVRFLRNPASYPEPTLCVEVVQTHMAFVFLTDRFAWKLKKPVRHDFLDFSTVELRRQVCEAELRLNRRLAPDVYLDVVPLVRTGDGQLHLGTADNAAPIDWLVKMRRLPSGRMLDCVIRSGGPTAGELAAVGALLAAFYQAAPIEPIEPDAYFARLAHALDDDVRELMACAAHLPVPRTRSVGRALHARLTTHAHLFRERAWQGRIREVHGDLRPEHICVDTPPVIIDCLEFSRELRLLDPADELAFLTLECERLGSADTGRAMLRMYQDQTGDEVDPAIVEFHIAARALLRAKLAIWHLRDGKPAAASKWTAAARDYIVLAARHAGMAPREGTGPAKDAAAVRSGSRTD